MAENPKACSTPKLYNVKGRRGIGESNKILIQSPINDNNEDESDSNNESDDFSKEDSLNTTFCNCIGPTMGVSMTAIVLVLVLSFLFQEDTSTIQEESVWDIKKLKKMYPSQAEDFWLTIEINIREIETSDQPKTFLFLYNEESKKTTENIIYGISKYAVCTLTKCDEVPLSLTGHDLNNSDSRNDYGIVITSIKEKLEKSGVMILKNLEDVPGRSAQAFHSFCDEYNPLVKKALFIFTMKVEKNNEKNVEKYLRNLWKDIKDDHFYPLFTRISSNIIPIVVER